MAEAIVKYESQEPQDARALTVQEALAWEIEVADVVASLVEKQKWFLDIGNKRYLEAEAWEFIGLRTNTDAMTEWVRAIKDASGNTVAYEARVALMKGIWAVGAAEMTCGLDEFPCQGKEGWAKDKAARSAAQTWAMSKAYRMKYGFIARLAGFEPTPAEEMTGAPGAARPPADSPYYCKVHKTPWFKKGAMRNFSHPIGDSGKWCNMPTPKQEPHPSAEGQAVPEPPAQPVTKPQAAEGMTQAEFLAEAAKHGFLTQDAVELALGCTLQTWRSQGRTALQALSVLRTQA